MGRVMPPCLGFHLSQQCWCRTSNSTSTWFRSGIGIQAIPSLLLSEQCMAGVTNVVLVWYVGNDHVMTGGGGGQARLTTASRPHLPPALLRSPDPHNDAFRQSRAVTGVPRGLPGRLLRAPRATATPRNSYDLGQQRQYGASRDAALLCLAFVRDNAFAWAVNETTCRLRTLLFLCLTACFRVNFRA